MQKKTRPRNAAATRAAILDSAFAAFARSGYDGVGVREIAGNAGVTAMLVNRYFGSKEQLFAEVVAKAMTTPSVMSGERIGATDPADAIAAALVAKTGAGEPQLDGMRIILNSASSPRAVEIIREQIEKYHHALMTSAIAADHPAERAALALAIVAGFQFMRQMIGLNALVKAEPEILSHLLGDALTATIGDPPAAVFPPP